MMRPPVEPPSGRFAHAASAMISQMNVACIATMLYYKSRNTFAVLMVLFNCNRLWPVGAAAYAFKILVS